MSRDEQLKLKWDYLVQFLSDKFGDGEILDLDAILFLIGVQELGQWQQNFAKDEKVNLMHIGICCVLEPYGYYAFDYVDQDGWPHYKTLELLPPLKAGEQSLLLKEAIVQYFTSKGFFP